MIVRTPLTIAPPAETWNGTQCCRRFPPDNNPMRTPTAPNAEKIMPLEKQLKNYLICMLIFLDLCLTTRPWWCHRVGARDRTGIFPKRNPCLIWTGIKFIKKVITAEKVVVFIVTSKTHNSTKLRIFACKILTIMVEKHLISRVFIKMSKIAMIFVFTHAKKYKRNSQR